MFGVCKQPAHNSSRLPELKDRDRDRARARERTSIWSVQLAHKSERGTRIGVPAEGAAVCHGNSFIYVSISQCACVCSYVKCARIGIQVHSNILSLASRAPALPQQQHLYPDGILSCLRINLPARWTFQAMTTMHFIVVNKLLATQMVPACLNMCSTP